MGTLPFDQSNYFNLCTGQREKMILKPTLPLGHVFVILIVWRKFYTEGASVFVHGAYTCELNLLMLIYKVGSKQWFIFSFQKK